MSVPADLIVIGAGPAGMAAAVRARGLGLRVTVLDEQPAPGGQIWRAIESRAGKGAPVGDEAAGRALVKQFRESGATYLPGRQVWQVDLEHRTEKCEAVFGRIRCSNKEIEQRCDSDKALAALGFKVYASASGTPETVEAKALVLATGAQERPVPFPGWTLPGVLTVGAAQILLKTSGQIPDHPVLIAGSGPLILLYACQLLDAGGRIRAILDTAPRANRTAGLARLPQALAGGRDLLRGLAWIRRIKTAGVPVIRNVRVLEAQGDRALRAVRYETESGRSETVPASLLLVHEGVVPSVHMPLALGCDYRWRDDQRCFAPVLDAWGESSVPSLFVCGDGAAIGGAASAVLKGEIAAIGAAMRLGRVGGDAAETAAAPLRKSLKRALATRPFLDALYRTREAVLAPGDDTVVCRCEEIRAGQIRQAAGVGIAGANQVKTFTRCGMGPCQGRQCGLTVSSLLAEASGQSMDAVGFYRIRPPLKPVTLAELAALDTPDVEIHH